MFRLLSALLLGLFLAQAGLAQAPKKVYSEVYYHKIKPGHTYAEARAIENEFKKIHQVQADEGAIEGWYMLALDMSSNPNKEYSYVTVKSFSDPGYMDNAYPEAVLKKVMGTDYQAKLNDLSKRMGEIKEVAKAEIWQVMDGGGVTPMPSPAKFPVWVANSIKIKNSQYDQYVAQVNKLKPVLKERISQGNLVGWNLTGLMYPGGTEKGYDFSFISYYANAKQLLDLDEAAVFKKALPGTDINKYYTELDQIRDRTRQEVYYLVEFAVKATPAQAASK